MMILMVGCSEVSGYDDTDVAATVRGNEITVGDLRFLYPDDTALDYLEGAISVELVKQEVKDMSLDISDNLSDNDNWFMELPPKNTKDEDGKQIRKFAEAQAKKLDMEPEEYQREYAKKIDEQNAYMVTYLEEKPGAIDTPMLRGSLEETGQTEEEFAPQLSLLGRFGQAKEIAEASLWLASDQSSYLTGTTIHADAGYTSR